MTDNLPICGCVHRPTGPRLRLVKVDPLDPRQIIPVPMSAAYTEARRLARKAVKEGLQRQGIRPIGVPYADISKAANDYLKGHPELVDLARERLAGTYRKRV
jgi:hypothetical protein